MLPLRIIINNQNYLYLINTIATKKNYFFFCSLMLNVLIFYFILSINFIIKEEEQCSVLTQMDSCPMAMEQKKNNKKYKQNYRVQFKATPQNILRTEGNFHLTKTKQDKEYIF